VSGFCSFAGDGGCHHRQRREKERKPTGFPAFLTAAHETTRRQWRARVGRRAATVPAVAGGLPCNFWSLVTIL